MVEDITNCDIINLNLQSQIEAIQKEVQTLKVFYFNTLADYRFDTICNKYQSQILESEDLEEKLALCEKMYAEIVDYLYDETQSKTDPNYPECASLEGEEEILYVVSDVEYTVDGELPFN